MFLGHRPEVAPGNGEFVCSHNILGSRMYVAGHVAAIITTPHVSQPPPEPSMSECVDGWICKSEGGRVGLNHPNE